MSQEEIEIADEVMKWSNGMFIPFSLIGIDGSNPPETLRLNIYKCGGYGDSWTGISSFD